MAFNSKKVSVSDVVFRGTRLVVGRRGWQGTMTDLMTGLNEVLNTSDRASLPRSPAALRMVVNKVINRLRNSGLSVRFGRATDRNRTRFVKFAR
jgi:hypothetical protein